MQSLTLKGITISGFLLRVSGRKTYIGNDVRIPELTRSEGYEKAFTSIL